MENSILKKGKYLSDNSEELVKLIFEKKFLIKKDLSEKFSDSDKKKFLQGIRYHLSYLEQSIDAGKKNLFIENVKWANILLKGIGISDKELINNMEIISQILKEELPEELNETAYDYMLSAMDALKQDYSEPASFIKNESILFEEASHYLKSLLDGNRREASVLILGLAKKNIDIKDIYLEIFQPVQYEIGRLWQTNKVSVAQEHYCTAVTQMVMSQLYPYIFNSKKKEKTFIGACVSNELHEIGLRMISDLLELSGWDTYYLGSNTPTESIIDTIAEKKADLLGISATMTFQLNRVSEIIDEIKASKEAKDIKIMVGGYVFNIDEGLFKNVGAHGYALDGKSALKTAESLVS